MRKTRPDIRQQIETPVMGFGIMLLALVCLLLLLWILIILVRLVASLGVIAG